MASMVATHVLAVMGETGVGKSTFVKLVTGNNNVKIGHSMESETSTITSYEVTIRDKKYVLIDTPGFNDTYLCDSEVLRRLVEWLKSTYQAGTKLSGILYLHRITDTRMQGSALRNLNMFKQLCGESFYKNITLGTTCWALVSNDVAEKRQKELIQNSNFWKSMLDRGTRLEKIPDDVDAARDLVARISNQKAMVPQVVVEMERGTSFADLAVTRMLNYELEQQREKQEVERKRLLEEQEKQKMQRETKARELLQRRQFHADRAMLCSWMRPHGNCHRCGRNLSDRGQVYHCCSCNDSDEYWHCNPCGSNCGNGDHPAMSNVGEVDRRGAEGGGCRIL